MWHNILEGIGWTVGMFCAVIFILICFYTIVYLIKRDK